MPADTYHRSSIVGLILAGGRASRMGGCNKGLVDYRHKPLVSYAADNLKSVTDNILVCTNSEKDAYQALGFEVIDDGEFVWKGPLAGINAGFEATDSEYLAVIACDQLSLAKHIYPTLLSAAQSCPAKTAIAADSNRSHPTCAVLHRSQHHRLRDNLLNNKLRAGWWFKEIEAEIVEFKNETFSNINYRDELK